MARLASRFDRDKLTRDRPLQRLYWSLRNRACASVMAQTLAAVTSSTIRGLRRSSRGWRDQDRDLGAADE